MSLAIQTAPEQSTFKSIVETLELLTDDKQQMAFEYITELLHEDQDSPFARKSGAEIMASIDRSIEQADRGEGEDALEALEEIVRELAWPAKAEV